MTTPAPIVLPPLKWVASPNFSTRHAALDLVVLHDTEGGYDGSVSWFANAHSEVSAHVVLKEDGSEATQMVKYGDKAWHCAAFNSRSVGLEMAGFFEKESDHQLRVAARIVAFWLHKFGIPAHVSDGSHPGFCRHRDLGVAGGGHHDPFGDPTWVTFQGYVAHEVARGGFRPEWGQ